MAQNSSRTINHFPSSSSSSLAAAGPRAWYRSCGGHMSVADGLIFRIYKKKIHIWISHPGKPKPNPKGPREQGDLKGVGGAAAREHSGSRKEAGTETACAESSGVSTISSAPHRALRPELQLPWGKSQALRKQRWKEPAEAAGAGLSSLEGGRWM